MKNAKELLLSGGQLALKVTPRARSEGIEGVDTTGSLKVKVRAVAEDGKANEAVIELLADAFGIPKSRFLLVRGATSRHKVIALKP